jgi:glutaredoxin 3
LTKGYNIKPACASTSEILDIYNIPTKCVKRLSTLGKDILNNTRIHVVIVKNCTFCKNVKRLLFENGYIFTELEVQDDIKDDFLLAVAERTNNYKKFPMIFINDKFAGGYNDLLKLFTPKTHISNSGSALQMAMPSPAQSTNFIGTYEHMYATLLYFKYKFGKITCIHTPRKTIKKEILYNIPYDFDIILEINENTKTIDVKHTEVIKKSIDKCKKLKKKKEFFIVPLGLEWVNSPIAHSNFVIYNFITHELELFEPHTVNEYRIPEHKVHSSILNTFTNIFNLPVSKYHKPIDYCPYFGIQTLQYQEKQKISTDPGGFCQAWSTWYVDTRLSNPKKTRKQVIDLALQLLTSNSISFTEFIRSYSAFLDEIKQAKTTDDIKALIDAQKKY